MQGRIVEAGSGKKKVNENDMDQAVDFRLETDSRR